MRRIVSIILLVFILAGALFADANREFRATWSITWHQFSGSMSAEQLKARTREILDKHVEAGMNAVLFQVRQGGTVYYPSAIEPWGSYIGYSDPGYDPLAYAVKEAHKRGLELHAWFNTFHCSSTISGAPAAEHPEWVCRDGSGNAMGASRSLSPGLKAVRDYTVNLAAEIVANYDIDGIHFDYVRWNEYDTTEVSTAFAQIVEDNMLPDGVFPPGMEEYLIARETQDQNSNRAPMVPTPSIRYLFDVEHPESGGIPDRTDIYPDATPGVPFDSWADWRRAATNVFIEAVHDTVQKLKPWVKVSPAALGRYKAASWNGYYSVFQDAAKWFNEGWIDLLTPMCYHWLNGREMKDHLVSDWEPNISTGIAAGRPFSVGPGSYLISTWGAHMGIVNRCRELAWVKGFQFFSYGDWKDSEYALESSHTVFANKTKQPSYDFMNSTVPPAPTLAMLKNNDTTYTLTITPDVSVTDPQWFVIYRSNNSSIDVDSTEIVKIVYSDSVFTHEETFNGLQLSNKYYYGVTQCSRYWVESPISNILSTQTLPTTLPMVVTNDPVNSATDVPNNKIVTVEFNKNMDPESIEANLSITPALSNQSLSWDHPTWVKEDHLILNISGSWAFSTVYTVTLGGATEDQAGLQLDGNKDGSGGDAYSFSFTISGADAEPPIVQMTYPEDGDVGVDTDVPVTLVFNELIDISTLSGHLKFHYNGIDLAPSYAVMTGEDNKSYVNVKPSSFYPSSSVVTLELLEGICDTAGNPMSGETISFRTDSTYYLGRSKIDGFTGTYSWWNPSGSGSTSGINESSSTTSFVRNNRVAGLSDNNSMKITIVPTSASWFVRVHARDLYLNTTFDATMSVLQAYVYGDGSGNKFRFSIREDGSPNTYEVSTWYTMDWIGWQLIEWDIHDPSQFGEWGGLTNGIMDGTSYGFESIQFSPGTEDPEAPFTVYVDQLRMANKAEGTYPTNHRPVIEAIPDTTVPPSTGVYYYAEYSDPDEGDALSMDVITDTSAVSIRRYTSPAEKFRLKADEDYIGTSKIMVIVKDNGVGELADTAFFNFNVVASSIAEIPESFKVHPNYPNPFNPVTTLSFDLPVTEHVKIEIFNTRGQKVAVLADQRFDAGSWDLQFNASFLSSGVYFYKISAGEEYYVNRMTLLK